MLLTRLACVSIRRNYYFANASIVSYSGILRTGLGSVTSTGTTLKRGLAVSSSFKSDNMGVEDAFREMEANGVPKQGQPTAAAAPQQEQQKELPKLSAAEFRVYNRMAEHMDMFVRFHNDFLVDC